MTKKFIVLRVNTNAGGSYRTLVEIAPYSGGIIEKVYASTLDSTFFAAVPSEGDVFDITITPSQVGNS